MKKEELLEAKQLVADFVNHNFNLGCASDFKGKIPESMLKGLKYNSDWNLIMKVVTTIENLGYTVTIGTWTNIFKLGLNIHTAVVYVEGYSKKENTFLACVEFIKWHNKQELKSECNHDWYYVGTVGAEFCNKCRGSRDLI